MDYKLQIKFIYSTKKRWWWRFLWRDKPDCPIQYQPFRYGLSFKNIDINIFPGGKGKNLNMGPATGLGLSHEQIAEFPIPPLNPEEEKEVWIEEGFVTPLEGVLWISCKLEAENSPENRILSYQIEPNGTVAPVPRDNVNTWGDGLSVIGYFHFGQMRTNLLLILLTAILSIDAVFGLKNSLVFVLKNILTLLKTSLSFLVDLLQFLLSLVS